VKLNEHRKNKSTAFLFDVHNFFWHLKFCKYLIINILLNEEG
jgi:hypothetical protein